MTSKHWQNKLSTNCARICNLMEEYLQNFLPTMLLYYYAKQ
jgi:hypothetical protein